jgi:site-specific DNA recombinase
VGKLVALYGRFSTEHQNAKSAEDQLADCRAYAWRQGYTVVGEYEDAAKSSTSLHNRKGLDDLRAIVKGGQIRAVIVEATNRLSRSQADIGQLFREFEFYGTELETPTGGKVDKVRAGLDGLTGEMQLDAGKVHIRRGLDKVVASGRRPGGKVYGYRKRYGPVNGLQDIEPAEEAVVRRIFEEFAAGTSTRGIAHALNRDGIPAPRGDRWTGNTINGSRTRQNGILENQQYVGRVVYNKSRKLRHPDTGKRVNRPNPPSEWKTFDDPALRIIPDELWLKVQARLAHMGRPRKKGEPILRQPHMLSGLLRCGACGGALVIHGVGRQGRRRVRCSAAREAGTCANTSSFYIDEIEETVLRGVMFALRHPQALEVYVEEYKNEMARQHRDVGRRRTELQKDHSAACEALDRLVAAVAAGAMPLELVKGKSDELTAERDRLKTELDIAEREAPTNINIHPEALEHFQRTVRELAGESGTGTSTPHTEALNQSLREFIVSVTIHEPKTVSALARIAPIVWTPARRTPPSVAIRVVPQEGLEPPTYALRIEYYLL